MNGIIIKDDNRYDYVQKFLEDKGHKISTELKDYKRIDFLILPFKNISETGEVYLNNKIEKLTSNFFEELNTNTKIFTGIYNEYVKMMCHKYNLKYYSAMLDEEVIAQNAYLTSEGVICYIIANTKISFQNMEVMICGYGVCGQDLAIKLKKLGAEVTALVRNEEKSNKAKQDRISHIYIDEVKNKKFDVIINTVPNEVLTQNTLNELDKSTLLIDIASYPYGFNIEYANSIGLKAEVLPSLPAKVAPKTAGIIIGEFIQTNLLYKGGNNVLKGKKIGFGITGSFCTINLIKDILAELVSDGADVYPVLSATIPVSDTRFAEAKAYVEEIEEITGKKCVVDIVEAEEFGPKIPLDLMVIVPISGVSISKFANAINDSPPLLSAKATLRNDNPVLLGVFTNDGLGLCGVNIMQLMATKNVFMLPFGQNDPFNKHNSITSDLSKLKEAIILALDKKQIQPVLVENFEVVE